MGAQRARVGAGRSVGSAVGCSVRGRVRAAVGARRAAGSGRARCARRTRGARCPGSAGCTSRTRRAGCSARAAASCRARCSGRAAAVPPVAPAPPRPAAPQPRPRRPCRPRPPSNRRRRHRCLRARLRRHQRRRRVRPIRRCPRCRRVRRRRRWTTSRHRSSPPRGRPDPRTPPPANTKRDELFARETSEKMAKNAHGCSGFAIGMSSDRSLQRPRSHARGRPTRARTSCCSRRPSSASCVAPPAPRSPACSSGCARSG